MSKETQVKKSRTFFLAIALALVAVIVTVVIALSVGRNQSLEAPSSSSQKLSTSSQNVPNSSSNKPSSSEDDGDNSTTPTIKEITFIMPVENGVCIKDFTEDTVVFNQTLNVYTGHMGMDIAGSEGAFVYCCYEGEIEDISNGYLEGTTVTINHGNGLKSVYNSIEVLEDLEVGMIMLQGEKLGTISTNNRQEYKDGAHLHFEVLENGVKISPTKYLYADEK